MKKILLAQALIVPFTLLLGACGDDGGSTDSNETASCTVFESGENAYTIKCPDGTEVVIHDGANGENGKNGSDGKNGADGTDGKNGADGSARHCAGPCCRYAA